MSSIDNLFGISGLGTDKPARQPVKALGQEQFLELMIAQLKNQDPLKPMQNGEFLGQLAQFGTVNGIQQLQQSFASLSASLQSSQALMASSLVGRSVLVPSAQAALADGANVSGVIELPVASASVAVGIYTETGALVRRIDLGAQPAGQVRFTWDGKSDAGQPLPPGQYRIRAESVDGGVSTARDTLVSARVDSVSLGGTQGLQLNLAGLGAVPLAQIRQIG
jgi:flagellar basal-body rod modification protein FlgD